GSHTKTAEFFMSIVESFGWTRLGLVFHDLKFSLKHTASDCMLRLTPIYNMLTRRNMYAWHSAFNENDDTINLEIFEGIRRNCR
ncbi:hypothetical protein BgiMline_036486, partial [Biomphalaria glabrata]